ncbi:hypothetical protein EVAR_33214_1 [Eumeta japonica]|uniref:Uncharacterized protein n=1 Tax=Eumeta variegata TaxID=151549 RepID=A0A4C1W3N5_EUMVA|nr:hypothetical protein EVAR_33214_1 [Eumeta japonica]
MLLLLGKIYDADLDYALIPVHARVIAPRTTRALLLVRSVPPEFATSLASFASLLFSKFVPKLRVTVKCFKFGDGDTSVPLATIAATSVSRDDVRLAYAVTSHVAAPTTAVAGAACDS